MCPELTLLHFQFKKKKKKSNDKRAIEGTTSRRYINDITCSYLWNQEKYKTSPRQTVETPQQLQP